MLNCVKLLKKYCISFKVVFRRFKALNLILAYEYIEITQKYSRSKIDLFVLKNQDIKIIYCRRAHYSIKHKFNYFVKFYCFYVANSIKKLPLFNLSSFHIIGNFNTNLTQF